MCRVLLCGVFLFSYINSFAQDSLSLNEFVNIEINKAINKTPPIFKLEVFKNGKIMKRGFKVYALNGEKEIGKSQRNKIFLDLKGIKITDSVFFIAEYKNRKILTEKYEYKRFIHGGKLMIGVVLDYHREKKKYFSDTTSYYHDNVKSNLYRFMNKIIKEDVLYSTEKYELYYYVLNFTNTPLTDYKYEMKKKGSQ